MRTLLFFLLFCTAASGQSILFPEDSAVIKETEGLPSQEPFDTSRSYQKVNAQYIYIISGSDLYNLFDYKTYMKFYGFNFASYHILGTYECRQCLQYCHHDEGQNSCHRNRCNKEWIWLMRDNKKAFTEIPSSTFSGHIDADIPHEWRSFIADTIISSKKDKAVMNWYTHGQGDCFAKFKYNVFSDNYYPAVLLKERNYWGGCRAGGGKSFTISFKMPASITMHTKRIILMEKYGKDDWREQYH